MVVEYVQNWRRKLLCTCDHIKKKLKLDVGRLILLRTLAKHNFHWRQVPHNSMIKSRHFQKRKEFVDKHLHHRPAWWVENMHLVFDGVTLTKAPRKLSSRQKHAAQSIKAMWIKRGEAMDPEVHTYNRYSLVAAYMNCANKPEFTAWLVAWSLVVMIRNTFPRGK